MLKRDLWEYINTEKSNYLFVLYERYQEEKGYEDIEEYLKVIKNSIPQAVSMTKRPFGVLFSCPDGILKVDIIREGSYLKLRGKFSK